MNIYISSSKNEKFKYIKNLKQKKFRTEEYTVEGKKSVEEALASQKTVTSIILSESFCKKYGSGFPSIPHYIISDNIFPQLSSTDTPSGILCTIKIERDSQFSPDLKKAYIYCDKISDPGNLGTIIRTADAAGFSGVLLSPGCCELYNPKTVRSSMGSFFRMPVYENIGIGDLQKYRQNGFRLLSGTLSDSSVSYTDADMTKPTIIVIGNESNGISDEVLAISDQFIKIPILGGAESLNAAIAAGIIMYEVLRQRGC